MLEKEQKRWVSREKVYEHEWKVKQKLVFSIFCMLYVHIFSSFFSTIFALLYVVGINLCNTIFYNIKTADKLEEQETETGII